MKFRMLTMPYYLGLSVLFVACLFMLQHWPGGRVLWVAGAILLALFVVFAAIEVFTSSKADNALKGLMVPYFLAWAFVLIFMRRLVVLLIVFVLGTLYHRFVRKRVITTKKDFNNIKFDSL